MIEKLIVIRRVRAALVVALFCLSGCVFVPFKVEPLTSGASAKKINLVFVPLHYQTRKDFIKDREILTWRLQKTVPFNEFLETVKLWDLDITESQARKIFISIGAFPPVQVDPGFLKKMYGRIGANYKLILLDKTGTIVCSELSSPEATSVIFVGRERFKDESFFPSGFLHELGHSLGLRDESPKNYAQSCAPGYPNCAATKQEAERWWGDKVGKDPQVGFFPGCCGRADYFRPTGVSLMYDIRHSSNFGPVNEGYLRKALEDYRGF